MRRARDNRWGWPNAYRRTAHFFSKFLEFAAGVVRQVCDARGRRGAFTRQGPLSPTTLIALLLYMVADANRSGYRHLLDAFWDEAGSFGLTLPTQTPVSAAAFTNARHRLPAEVVRKLLHQAADTFEAEFGATLRWFGRRVFGVDGSKMNLRRATALDGHFGTPADAYCPQALGSTLFNLVSRVPHDVVVAPGGSSEREQLYLLLDRVQPGDVLVMDRGYPSFEVVRLLLDAKIEFVLRVPQENTFPVVTAFAASGVKDQMILITAPRGPMQDCAPIPACAPLRPRPRMANERS